jgi:Trk-type K+ transport system membrane component
MTNPIVTRSRVGYMGFDLMGDFRSLTGFTGDIVINITIMGLIITGGLGFAVLAEIHHYRPGKKWLGKFRYLEEKISAIAGARRWLLTVSSSQRLTNGWGR